MELPSIHAVTALAFRRSSSQVQEAEICGTIAMLIRIDVFMIKVNIKYLGPRVTRILSRVFVRGASPEGQQDLSGGSRVKHRVTFGDWDVHEFRRTAGSS